jgi:hypothetical protein
LPLVVVGHGFGKPCKSAREAVDSWQHVLVRVAPGLLLDASGIRTDEQVIQAESRHYDHAPRLARISRVQLAADGEMVCPADELIAGSNRSLTRSFAAALVWRLAERAASVGLAA